MICLPCRQDDHRACPELARQAAVPRQSAVPRLSAVELAASNWCNCGHKPREAPPESA